jgi:sodium transport system permease protein
VLDALDAVEAEAEVALAGRLGVPPAALEAPELRLDDRSPPRATAARILGGLLPMVLLLGVLVAGVYPSVELVVGDRARGSLETTLSLACPRWVPLAGRAAALIALMWASAAGNLFAVALTVAHFRVALGLQAEDDPGLGSLLPAVSPGALAVSLAQLALSSALIAAMYVVALTPARTHKQGQSVASLVLTLGLPAVVAAGLPMVPFTPALAAAPLLGGGLLLREALSGQPLPPTATAVALLGHALQAAALVGLAARLSGHEGAWFAGPGPVGRFVARIAGDR